MKTILLITSDRLVRADFRGRGSPRLVGCWEQYRGADDGSASLVELTLSLGPRRVRDVWLLTTDVTTSVLPVSRDILAGSGPDDLPQLLAFEAEAFTGQVSFETALSHVPLPTNAKDEEPRFWITQVPNDWQSAAEEAVRRHRGRLLGIAHPAGVARRIGSDSPSKQPWRRLELWDDLAVAVRGLADGNVDVDVLPRTQRPDASFDEVLLASGMPLSATAADAAADALRFADRSTLERWLTAWVESLSATRTVVPVHRIPKPPLTVTQRRAVMLACAAASMLFCFGWYWLGQQRLKLLAVELERIQAPSKRLEQLKDDETKLAKDRDELLKQATNMRREVELLVTGMTRQSERQARLLATLSQFSDEHVVIQKIDGQVGETQLSGLCLRSGCVQTLARKLSRELEACGWQVSPAKLSSTGVLSDGGPWKFTIVLKDLPAKMPLAPQPKEKKKVANR